MALLGVNVAVLRENTILLTKREDFEVWCLPGGAVEAGESIAEAAIREVREETGLIVRLTRMVGIYSRPHWKQHAGQYHIVVFATEPLGGTLHAQPDEVVDLDFFASDRIPELLLFGQRERINHVFAGFGGSVACSNGASWPFDDNVSRAQLYAQRDESGLSRADFYVQHLYKSSYEHDTIEVAGQRIGE
jgi:ADP-ribose pyrophosphatase YjhB (NUDIX family)